jgi:hypothetical protein
VNSAGVFISAGVAGRISTMSPSAMTMFTFDDDWMLPLTGPTRLAEAAM